MQTNQLMRFLLAGGSAAAINWLARLGLSLVVPFGVAVLLAYAIGMICGFFLYRWFVFQRPTGSLTRQAIIFIMVNAVGAIIVLAVAFGAKAILSALPFAPDTDITEALAHAGGIAAGAVANYFGHAWLTFRQGRNLLQG